MNIFLPTLVFSVLLVFGPVQAQLLTDIDGHTYPLILMGEHSWTCSNLEVKHFNNGDPIPQAQTAKAWLKANHNKSPAWCYYEDKNGVDETTVLYNWYAVHDTRGLAPSGSHVPSINEWTSLIQQTGGIRKCAWIVKSKEGWLKEQTTLTHEFNAFNVLPVGSRYSYLNASFEWSDGPSKGRYINFWTSSHGQYGLYGEHANRIGFSFDKDELITDAKSKTQFGNIELNAKGNGYSVRCIQDPAP